MASAQPTRVGSRVQDLAGCKFGRLTAISVNGYRAGRKSVLWLCRCECGGEVVVRGDVLQSGRSKSCGCGSNPTINVEAFWSRVVRSTSGCWEWQGSTSGRGYGCMVPQKKKVLAHRFSYQLHCGSIPPGVLVCHHCDNPKCVRPDHLFLGTINDNNQDKKNKGRCVRGHAVHTSKLTENDVRDIRAERDRGVPVVAIAERYGVSVRSVQSILSKETWGWLA